MRRARLVALLVVAACALGALAWWTSSRTAPPGHDAGTAQEPSPEPQPSVEGTIDTTQFVHLTVDERDPTTRDDPRQALESDEEAEDTYRIHGVVVSAQTGLPVHSGSATARFLPTRGLTSRRTAQLRQAAELLSRTQRVTSLADDGTFSLEIPCASSHATLVVSPAPLPAPDGSVSRTEGWAMEQVKLESKPRGEVTELRIEVHAGLELLGSVVDEEDGRPLAAASIRTLGNWAAAQSAGTDASGRFRLRFLRRARQDFGSSLDVSSEGYLAREVHIGPRDTEPGAQPLRIALHRGTTISGQLLDEGGVPLAGIWLRLRIDAPDPAAANEIETDAPPIATDSAGRFRFTPQYPGATAHVEAEEQRVPGGVMSRLRHELGTIGARPVEVVIRVAVLGELLVRAVRPGGAPLDSTQFQVLVENEPRTSVLLGSDDHARLVHAPRGVALHLSAYAAASPDATKEEFVRGSTLARIEGSAREPAEVVVMLEEHGSFAAPPMRADAALLDLPAPDYMRAAVDLEILDGATGLGLASPNGLHLSTPGSGLHTRGLIEGRVRVRGKPGTYRLTLEVEGGVRDALELVIPATGYASTQWRVETKR